MYLPGGGAFKYASNPTFEEITKIFELHERDKFIEAYKKVTKDDMVYDDVHCYYTETFTEIKDMDAVANAI